MSPEAFAKLSPLEAGRIPITWRYVACGVSGGITYHFKEGSNAYWTAVQIRSGRYAVATVEAKRSDGTFSALERQDYNYFVDASGLGEGPYAFRVTDVYGHVLEDDAVPFVEAGDSPGAGQFPLCD
jgi:expansin (peptidoglycan-binding protein)